MIEAVITKGWLDGGLQKAEPTPVDPATVRYQRILARIVSWERKLKRAENALVKLRRTKTYYERKGGI
jgi:hypothetical protein